MAAVERGGNVRLQKVPSRKAAHVKKFVKDHISGDVASVYTDDYAAYRKVFGKKTVHGHGRHSPLQVMESGKLTTKIEWVNGKIHTNTVAGVFSLLDRLIKGAAA